MECSVLDEFVPRLSRTAYDKTGRPEILKALVLQWQLYIPGMKLRLVGEGREVELSIAAVGCFWSWPYRDPSVGRDVEGAPWLTVRQPSGRSADIDLSYLNPSGVILGALSFQGI